MSAFSPIIADIVHGAFARLQIRGTEITTEHLVNARFEANLLQVQWGNQGPNLWTVDNQTIQLIAGQGTYDVPPDTIEILDTYLSEGLTTQPYDANGDANTDANVWNSSGQPFTFDRMLGGVSRSDFLGIPNKQMQGFPTLFWFQKGTAPKLNIWPVPFVDGLLNFWRTRQITDAHLSSGGTADIPYLWIDASVAGLAHRLARIYKPEMEAQRKVDAEEAWAVAAEQDTERANLKVTPDVSGYYS